MRARNKLACEIAQLHPDRMNEHIASGDYHCAPSTQAGKPRIYEIDDLVALCTFSHLMKMGIVAKKAGEFACQAFLEFRGTDAKQVCILRSASGSESVVCGDEIDLAPIANNTVIKTVIELDRLRAMITDHLERERATLGED